MKIFINGKEKIIGDEINNVSKLLIVINDILPKFFAIEKNNKIVYKENYDTEIINQNDRFEIVMFCGGG